jgi:hypothetical protein
MILFLKKTESGFGRGNHGNHVATFLVKERAAREE